MINLTLIVTKALHEKLYLAGLLLRAGRTPGEDTFSASERPFETTFLAMSALQKRGNLPKLSF
jgi:hypothetical protein